MQGFFAAVRTVACALLVSGCVAGIGAFGGFPGSHSSHRDPEPAPAAPGPTWMRLTLDTGEVLDCEIVGGDAVRYFVRMPQGTFSITRTRVVSAIALSPAAPVPAPAAGTPAPGTPAVDRTEARRKDRDARARIGGVLLFGVTYATTIAVAARAGDSDPSAKLAYIPVLGPVFWAAKEPDDDDFLYDVGDWGGLLVSLIQLGGVALVIAGAPGDDAPRKPNATSLRLRPLAGPGLGGFALGGRF